MRMNTCTAVAAFALLSVVSTLVAAPARAELARPGELTDPSLRFDQIVSVMAHNAFNYTGLPNQKLRIDQQLERGVRGFMLDVHDSGGELKVCHGVCTDIVGRVAPLQTDLRTISRFLQANPRAVVTVHLEMTDGVDRADLVRFIAAYPDALRFLFNPTDPRWKAHTDWPTVAEMIAANQRLVLMQDRRETAGAYNDKVYLFYDRDIVVQNTFSIGATIGTHDYTCSSRWADIPLDRKTGLRGWQRLFLMNHFHTVPEYYHADADNHWDTIAARVQDDCGPKARREPNFIAVDFVDRGDVLEYVEWRNNGGLIAYEGANATQATVCGFSTAFARSWSLHGGERLGCENDEMRSVVLQGMKKGQRVTFYDSSQLYRDDDFGVLNIDQDISIDAPQVFNLETSQANRYFRYNYSGGNGLAGKVSHIRVEPRAVPWADAAFTLHREGNGTGRVSCGFGAAVSGTWNLKEQANCHNDDARSLRILSAREGTVITLYDSPGRSTGDDYLVIRVVQPILSPVVVPDLERDLETAFLSVRYYRRNGLNGKVSAAKVAVP